MDMLITSIILTICVCIQYRVNAESPLRIVNGTTAEEGEFPYMVQLRTESFYFRCGGSIIGPEWILTAGHCIDGGIVGTIIYGTTKLYTNGDGYPNTSITVENWFRHPNYTYYDILFPLYDVGLLQLSKPIPFGKYAQPIELVEANADIPLHTQGVLSGWGFNASVDGILQKYLQKANLQVLTDEECTTKIDDSSSLKVFNSTHNICTDDTLSGGCSGDSGSPYVINGTQYGIVSWSLKPCGISPLAYSRISNPEYRDWIRSITNI